MVQIEVLSGSKAGAVIAARRFPVRVGRSSTAEVQLEDEGVWDEHLAVTWEGANGFVMKVQPHAIASVNGTPVERAVLGHGDCVEVGSVRFRFWLSPARQSRLWATEAVVWAALVAVAVAQIALILRLVR